MKETRISNAAERFALAWAAWAQRNRTPVPEPARSPIALSGAAYEAVEARWRAAYLETRLWFLRGPRTQAEAGADPGSDRGYKPAFASEVRLSEVGAAEVKEIPY